MHIALDCVQSANNGIGAAVQVSREIGFEFINSVAVIDTGSVHHFTLIKASTIIPNTVPGAVQHGPSSMTREPTRESFSK